jgi:hypothetical protein
MGGHVARSGAALLLRGRDPLPVIPLRPVLSSDASVQPLRPGSRRNQRAARARYQASIRGREMHAERSRRYRDRRRGVTDHGSISSCLAHQPVAAAPRAAAEGGAGHRHCALAENFLPPLRKTCLRLRSPRSNSPASSAINRKPLDTDKAPMLTDAATSARIYAAANTARIFCSSSLWVCGLPSR